MKTMNETLLSTGTLEDVTTFLEMINLKGGPETQEDYDTFAAIADILPNEEIAEFRSNIPDALDMNTLMGHGFVKPFGYAGDFMLIEKIYQNTVSSNLRYRNWDIFFHNQPAARAVRNRKKFFIRTLLNLVAEKKNARVLVLGSGPATDVFEFLSASGRKDITFDLVDLDRNAIDFSMKKNEIFKDQITFNQVNALRYTPFKFYDLIWTAGLFDYFKDKHFAYLIRKYYNNLTEDGRLIIGNFNTKNPTRNMMEKIIEWILVLRSESDLYRIAADAGVDNELVSVDSEPLGINLFMTIRKNLHPLN